MRELVLWLDVDHINGATYIHVAHLEFMLFLLSLVSLVSHYGKFWQNLSKKHFRVMQDSNLSHPEFLSAKAT